MAQKKKPAAKKPASGGKTRSKTTAARKTAKKPGGLRKGVAAILVIVLLVGVLGSVLIASPDALASLNSALGVTPKATIPPVEGDPTSAVHFIDVGQGDAVLMEDSGEWALLDAGPPEGEDDLLAYLSAAGVEKLRYVIMSHPHADHIGGMEVVVRQYEVGAVLLPDFEKAPYPTTKTFESLLETLVEKGTKVRTMVTDDEYPLGEGSIRVLQDSLETEDNYNLLSVALLFESAQLRFLATGDGEKANENALLDGGRPLNANLFKAGHHGSSTSNSKAFLEAVDPEVVVICCGADNSYGHPHKEPLDVFAGLGAQVLRTDRDGAVVVWPGEEGLAWSTAADQDMAA